MCTCKADVNARLAPLNAQLNFNYMNESDVFVQVIKLDEKVRWIKTPAVFATFCPFCGEKIDRASKSLIGNE